MALAGPMWAMRRKYIRYARPVQAMASIAIAPQAAAEGGAAGHQTAAGTARHSAAAIWLPAATASGGTPARRRLV